jgi:hypothetical protein
MIDPALLSVFVRFIAVALVIIAVSVASQRLGAFWGAVAASLPISIGPAYVLLALDHDSAFIAASALASLANYAVTVLYVVAYVQFAPGRTAMATICLCIGCWLLGVLLIRYVPVSIPVAVALNVVAFGLGFAIIRRRILPEAQRGASGGWGALLAKSGLMGALVAAIVAWSHSLGPVVTGIAVLFPIAMSSLALAFHPSQGGAVAAGVMAKALWTLPGIGFGLLILVLTAIPLGTVPALCLALAISLVWPLAVVILRRQPRRAAA